MNFTNPKHDLTRAKQNTWLSQRRMADLIQLGKNLEIDPERDRRHDEQLCQLCFYGPPKMAGQAFTTTNCGACEIEMRFSNTAVDRLCTECANKRACCRECGAHIDLANFYAFPADDGHGEKGAQSHC